MSTTTPPQNVEAEQAVLGSVLLSADALQTARSMLGSGDWYRPAHEQLWSLILELSDRGEPVDALTVYAEVMHTGKARTMPATYLHTLVSAVPTVANVAHYAQQVIEAADLRRLIYVHTHGTQRAYEIGEGASARSIGELVDESRLQLELVQRSRVGDGEIPGLKTWYEFFAEHAGHERNWVVPGLIGRKDVWMILAPPGAGKSTLSRQLAWSVAAGRHPFRPELPIQARATLLVDLENDEGQAADDAIAFYGRIEALSPEVGERGHIWSRPQGINLSESDDVALFDEVLRRTKPELVTFGSLTNSAPRRGDWDQLASLIRDVLNRMRTKYQFALWLEHHMPKAGEGGRRESPFGSQIFESWPSHGRVLAKTAEKSTRSPYSFRAPFRGDRGTRTMPIGFTRGGAHAWTPIWDQGELDVLTEQAQANASKWT